MSKLKAAGNILEYVGRAARKIVPASKKRVMSNLERDLAALSEIASGGAGGFTADVSGVGARKGTRVLGRLVDDLQDPADVTRVSRDGRMVATLPGQEYRIAADVLADPQKLRQELLSSVEKNPAILNELRKGAYLGGWREGGDLVVDASRRMGAKKATRVGLKGNQRALYNLKEGVDDVLQGEGYGGWGLAREMGRGMGRAGAKQTVGGAVLAGAGAADASDGNLSPLGFFALGAGAALGVGGALNIAKGSGLIRAVGSRVSGVNMSGREALAHMRLSKEELSDLAYEKSIKKRIKKLGLQESSELRGLANKYADMRGKKNISDADLAVVALREAGVNNPAVESAVRGAKTSRNRWETAYNVAVAHNRKLTDAQSGPEFAALKSEVMQQVTQSIPNFNPNSPAFVSKIAKDLRALFSGDVGLSVPGAARIKALDNIAVDTVSGVHTTIDPSLSGLGLRNVRYAQSADDVTDLIALGRFDEAAAAIADIEWNMAKLLTDVSQIKSRGEASRFYVLSMMRNRVQEAASRTPALSIAHQNAVASSQSSPVTEIAKANVAALRQSRGLPLRKVDEDILNAGDVFARNPSAALVDEAISGIGFKTSPYAQTQLTPFNINGKVSDSWMHRAVIGNGSLSNPQKAHTYALMNYVGNRVAKRNGLTSLPTIQEEAWYPARIIFSDNTQGSFVSTEGPKHLAQLTQRPTVAELRGISEKNLPRYTRPQEYSDYLGEMFDVGPLDSSFDILTDSSIRARGESLTRQQISAIENALADPNTREEALRRLAQRPGSSGVVTRPTAETFRPRRTSDVDAETVRQQRRLFGRRLG
jgi:hypothetical protein